MADAIEVQNSKSLTAFSLNENFISGVTIYEPESIPPLEFGSQNEVILQCDYDISDSEKGQLDLKWYFNDEVTPFLQWIPGGDRRPQLIEPTPFLGHVDLNYKIENTEDENKVYKDLKILDLTPQMAGNYACKVSTFEDEGYVYQQLNIFGMLIGFPQFTLCLEIRTYTYVHTIEKAK